MDIQQLRREIINRVIGIEGEFSNHADDSGGATKYGITQATASAHGIHNVRSLSVEQAFNIYISGYWHPLKLDGICTLSAAVAEELFEQGVNMGKDRAGEFLQRILNVLNQNQRTWPDLEVDGDVGAATLSALDSFFKQRGHRAEKVLLNMLNSLQSVFYIELAERRPKDETFEFGWQANRVDLPDMKGVLLDRAEAALGNPKQPQDLNDYFREMARSTAREVLYMVREQDMQQAPKAAASEPLYVLKYFVLDERNKPLPMKVPEDALLPIGEPDFRVMHTDGQMYPVYRNPRFAPEANQSMVPKVGKENAMDAAAGATVVGALATGLATAIGVDTGLSTDVAAGIAAGGSFMGVLYGGLKFAVKKLVMAKVGGALGGLLT